MASLNSFDFTGRLGRDPELRQTPNGHEVCKLSVAVDTFGERPTLWVDVSVWGGAASACAKYLEKGREVAIHGQIEEVGSFEKRDGTTGVNLRVSTRDVAFMSGRADGGSNGEGARSDVSSGDDLQPVGAGGAADDDIPF